MQKEYYTTGVFAKKADVTIRTIRYYDKQGILKPTHRSEAGYRLYTDEDFAKLQKILALKYLGFSLEEIGAMTLYDTPETMKQSLDLQIRLIEKKREHLELVESALLHTKKVMEKTNEVNWEQMLKLIHLTNMERDLVEQYKTSSNLNIRIELHKKYSKNKQGWFPWLYSQIDFEDNENILEIGCGNGELWKKLGNDYLRLKGKQIYLTDISEGMLEDAKEGLEALYPNLFSYAILEVGKDELKLFIEKYFVKKGNCLNNKSETNENIFNIENKEKEKVEEINRNIEDKAKEKVKEINIEDKIKNKVEEISVTIENREKDKKNIKQITLDIIIANHMLFYIKNVEETLGELYEVLRIGGTLYASTYGENHMKEITELVQEFDIRIKLTEVALYKQFGLQNGKQLLSKYFSNVELRMYEDELIVNDAKALADYILSCHGNQKEILANRYEEFTSFLEEKIQKLGYIRITKEAGVWIAKK